MPEWTRVADVAECPPGSSLEAVVGDQVIALFNIEGNYHALDGVCPHQGGPLGKGQLQGRIVTCPWHGWQFDVSSGRSQLSPDLVQRRFPCKTEAGQIFVDLSSGGERCPTETSVGDHP